MSHPSRLDLFKAWAKAMEAGATVDKPNYGKVKSQVRSTKKSLRRRNRRRKRRSLRRLKETQHG